MAFCTNCGFHLPTNAKFCFECGAKQEITRNIQPANKEKPFVAVFDDSSEYYEESDGVDLSSAYSQEDRLLTNSSANRKTVEQKPTLPKQKPKTVLAEVELEQYIDNVEEDVFEPVYSQPQKPSAKVSQPSVEEPAQEIEEVFEEDEIDEYNAVEPKEEKADLSQLSSFVPEDNPVQEVKHLDFDLKASKPVIDPYWDDVKPEIDNEIYQIDKSIILKGTVSVAALFGIIVYLIYVL